MKDGKSVRPVAPILRTTVALAAQIKSTTRTAIIPMGMYGHLRRKSTNRCFSSTSRSETDAGRRLIAALRNRQGIEE